MEPRLGAGRQGEGVVADSVRLGGRPIHQAVYQLVLQARIFEVSSLKLRCFQGYTAQKLNRHIYVRPCWEGRGGDLVNSGGGGDSGQDIGAVPIALLNARVSAAGGVLRIRARPTLNRRTESETSQSWGVWACNLRA